MAELDPTTRARLEARCCLDIRDALAALDAAVAARDTLALRLEASEQRSLKRAVQRGLYKVRWEQCEAAIRRVLADAESRPGGWGPDVTCVAILRGAIEETRDE